MKFKVGDLVIDLEGDFGEVISTWGDACKVRWNDRHEDWVDERFLRLNENRAAQH